MIWFWLFMIILIICITVVVCVFLQNADNLHIYEVHRAFREIDCRLERIEESITEQKAGGKNE